MPTGKNGKVCYIEMPAQDVQASADFYQRAFGWTIRQRGDGATAFDDTTGEVSGAFVANRIPMTPGLLFYIMVDSLEEAVKKVEESGGWVVQYPAHETELIAWFRDPGGNVVGLYQEPV